MSTAVYLINRSTQALHNKTLFEAWHGIKPSINHLRVSGSISYALITSHKPHKLDEKSEKCLFVGYSFESKAYRLFNPILCKIIVSRDMVFHKGTRSNWESVHGEIPIFQVEDKWDISENAYHIPSSTEDLTEGVIDETRLSSYRPVMETSTTQIAPTDETPPRCTKLLTDIYNACTFVLPVVDPVNFKEVVKSKERQEAMDVDIYSITRNDTWVLCVLLARKKAVGLKWIYKAKLNADDQVKKLKARVVAKGYSQ